MASQRYTEFPESAQLGPERYNLRPRGFSATTASATSNDKGHEFIGTEEGNPSQAATHLDRFGLVNDVPRITGSYYNDCEFAFPALKGVKGGVILKDGRQPTCDACFDLTTELAEETGGFVPNRVSVKGYTTKSGTELKRYPAEPNIAGNDITVRWLYQADGRMQIIAYEGRTTCEGSGKDVMEHGKGQLYMSEVMPANLPERMVQRALWQKSQASVE
jgi:hypothetical protein